MKNIETKRQYLIVWLYGIAILHFVVGVLLAWGSSLDYFDAYNHEVLSGFFSEISQSESRFQAWWLSLFGATLQNIGIFMGAMIYVGNLYRNKHVWLWMIAGVLVWAPQDILISLQAGVESHLWLDSIALLLILPPLISLWNLDRKNSIAESENK
ncbi:MAG: cell division protein [Gammaproteobacteria bacterium]|nr:MAG: cell division protein [Gammaproteobacteria bacterium]